MKHRVRRGAVALGITAMALVGMADVSGATTRNLNNYLPSEGSSGGGDLGLSAITSIPNAGTVSTYREIYCSNGSTICLTTGNAPSYAVGSHAWTYASGVVANRRTALRGDHYVYADITGLA